MTTKDMWRFIIVENGGQYVTMAGLPMTHMWPVAALDSKIILSIFYKVFIYNSFIICFSYLYESIIETLE